jgi:tetratricopeptide (TPR) repeat protein
LVLATQNLDGITGRGTRLEHVSDRSRVALVVAALACAAAGAVVGVTVLQTRGEERGTLGVTTPQKGRPPLFLDLGLRTDPEAVALRRAGALYAGGEVGAAGRIFERYGSLQARIGAAFARWPDGSRDRLQELVAESPGSGVALLHLGLADYWAGRVADAGALWRRAAAAQPDTSAAVTAGTFLHPGMVPGLPFFVPSFAVPASVVKLSAPEEFRVLRRAAERPDAHAKLLFGVELQNLGRPISAERQFAAAARLAPDDPDAQVAAAVGRFTKDHPERAFSRLGPLVKRFPHAATVRFHLGLLLLWIRDVGQARRELAQARTEAPASPVGEAAQRLLSKLPRTRTK